MQARVDDCVYPGSVRARLKAQHNPVVHAQHSLRRRVDLTAILAHDTKIRGLHRGVLNIGLSVRSTASVSTDYLLRTLNVEQT
jgi:hypothetical protein